MRKARWVAAVLLLLPLSAPAGAQVKVLYDTFPLDNPGNSNRPIGFLPFPPFNFPPGRSDQYADPFVVPVGDGDYLLELLTLRLRVPPFNELEGDMRVRLRSDGVGVPGAVLKTWQVPFEPILNRPRNVALAPDEGEEVLLVEGDTYWVSVSMVSTGTEGRWGMALATASDAWRFAKTNAEQPAWLLPVFSGDPLGLLTVEAILVPEPSATALAWVSLSLAAGLARRRRSVRAGRG